MAAGRSATAAAGALCVALHILTAAGCAVPYAYVRVDETRPIPLGEAVQDVTVVRVDYTAEGARRWDSDASNYTISLLKLDEAKGQVPAQARLSLTRGLYLYMVELESDLKTDDYVEVRIYRRGFRTVVVNDSYDGSPLTWEPAETLRDRELAIDAVFSRFVAGSRRVDSEEDAPAPLLSSEFLFRFTPTGSLEFRRACEVGIAEYQALLSDDALKPDDRPRIAAKVTFLRRFVPGGSRPA